jgi:hypothetical protein
MKNKGPRPQKPSANCIPQTELNPKHYMEICVDVPVDVDSVLTPIEVTYKQLAYLAEQQIITRTKAKTLPQTSSESSVYKNVQLKHVHAWGPAVTTLGTISTLGTGTLTSPNFMTGLTLRVGQTAAMVPHSTKLDIVEGTNSRAFAALKGNATTWGVSTSSTVAFTVTPQFYDENSNEDTAPMYLQIGVNLF